MPDASRCPDALCAHFVTSELERGENLTTYNSPGEFGNSPFRLAASFSEKAIQFSVALKSL